MDVLEAKNPKVTSKPSDTAHKALEAIPETTLTKAEIEDRLITARISMLLHCPFYGNLACHMDLKDATSWCLTAATDGKYFYYNRNFIAALSNQELVFLWGHEVEHCVYDHLGRRGNRHPVLWNIANDYVVNMDLVEGKIGDKIKLVDICFDWKYRSWTSDEVYEDLFKQAEEEGRVFDQGTLDVHLDMGEGDDELAGNKAGNEPGPEQYTDEQKKEIREKFKNA